MSGSDAGGNLEPEPLDEGQIARLRTQVVAELEAIEQAVGDATDDARPVGLDLSIGRLSRVDAMQHQHLAIARRDEVLRRRALLRAALERIEDGRYGECLRCEEPIVFSRLLARPESTLCRRCQTEREG